MKIKFTKLGAKVNGWEMLLGTLGSYGIQYVRRAAVALEGLGCNQPADAIYPQLLTDAAGKPLAGANQYVMHFDKKELPPAEAFWSFTLYDKDGFTVPNSLNRATLSSWMDLKYNDDGSIDLYFQADSPGKAKETNWLPAPKQGAWNLTLRLYAPKREALDGTWSPSANQAHRRTCQSRPRRWPAVTSKKVANRDSERSRPTAAPFILLARRSHSNAPNRQIEPTALAAGVFETRRLSKRRRTEMKREEKPGRQCHDVFWS